MSREKLTFEELAALEPMDAFSKLSIDELFFISGGQGGSGCGATVTSACSFTGGI